MAKRKKKKKPKAAKIDWRQLLIQAAIDFTVGILFWLVTEALS